MPLPIERQITRIFSFDIESGAGRITSAIRELVRAHLRRRGMAYKSQAYVTARHLGLPEAIRGSIPSTAAYSLAQGRDEFYFTPSHKDMDLALWRHNQQLSSASLAGSLRASETKTEANYGDIDSERRTTASLHWPALLTDRIVRPHTTYQSA